ncbi:hypothetical protein E6P09_02950 [Haloferax mediterranei ATCC 33500]|uniref:Uncharacterized protein n=1 Tax=Haloferax mediterranei (strain ATCC 33500 / DSM 1411 / JCM 8866 / NBRC 14739 / NCIMB 2177 / R-4) TaxID=523841 RepID=I3R8V7_HALMT|nr:hypothetical protein [Haloferax mediterranei]AFK20667.1 hypothetical protein HFX_3003 [Haloferax mediterranei ATCC 33500]AHZ22849.1 hypothetical protein BM92_09450 [Haloferax mediterranei ATCC 33500]EMA03013.1 hypothetical protein C439_10530 [Haloferax mediterranei ATCC 33500]MDX5987806.1 hypothetical protein [Haloferax mediterranei ATCC 33500]QCQ74282.1 hypothetical protein E6P09_02950 [Haloferax mediterranei ATCC 33500]
MRIVSKLDPDTYDEIRELVGNGSYRDIDQFIQVAVDNQLRIEKDEESMELSDGGTKAAQAEQSETTSSESVWGYSVPENIPIADPYETDREDTLLFSQYYRFFPLKFVLLELAKVTADHGGAVELSTFRGHIEERVASLRDELVQWEEENDVKKQNRKSTGLPKTDVKNPEYSMKRFLDQYVGKIRKSDLKPNGMGDDLALIAFQPLDEDRCLVQLSPAGRQLVTYTNPILASGPNNTTISSEEAGFIVTHIYETLPTEFGFMEEVYELLEEYEGDSYTKHLDECREYLVSVPGFDDDPSENRLRSHTAGTLSRMVELGLVNRGGKRGVYVADTPPSEFAN